MESHATHKNIIESVIPAYKLVLLKNHRRSPSVFPDDFRIVQLAQTFHHDRSGSRPVQEIQAAKQGRFAGARFPQEHSDLGRSESD
jgi:hypothetical protein